MDKLYSDIIRSSKTVIEIDAKAFTEFLVEVREMQNALLQKIENLEFKLHYTDLPEWLTSKQWKSITGIKNWSTVNQWEQRGVVVSNGQSGHYKRYSKESAINFAKRKTAWERNNDIFLIPLIKKNHER